MQSYIQLKLKRRWKYFNAFSCGYLYINVYLNINVKVKETNRRWKRWKYFNIFRGVVFVEIRWNTFNEYKHPVSLMQDLDKLPDLHATEVKELTDGSLLMWRQERIDALEARILAMHKPWRPLQRGGATASSEMKWESCGVNFHSISCYIIAFHRHGL